MELRDYLRVLRRHWGLIAAVTFLAVTAASLFTFTATPQYASSARLYVSTAQSNSAEAYQTGLLSEQRISSYADLVSGGQLAGVVIDDLGLDMSTGELAAKVSAEVAPETVLLDLTVTDPVPAQAQAVAQSYAEGLSEMVRELETPPGKTVSPIKATIVEPASLPSSPVSPQPVRNLGVGLVLGLLLGIGIAVLRDILDTSIATPEDLAGLTDTPLLGAIAFDSTARVHPLVTSLDSHAPRVESFRVLRTNIQFIDVDTANKVFVVSSAVPEEGKTTTAVNLAITLAQAGHRTVLIECDLRRPRAAAALDLDNAIGVTTVLLGKVSLDDAIQKHDVSDLHVLGSGSVPPNPAELIQSNAMQELLNAVRGRYDIVLIDAPPLLPVTDAALLAAQSDGAILVVRHGKTTKDQFLQAVDRLDQVGGKVVGVVLNMVPASRRRSGYGYGYGYAPDRDETKVRTTGRLHKKKQILGRGQAPADSRTEDTLPRLDAQSD